MQEGSSREPTLQEAEVTPDQESNEPDGGDHPPTPALRLPDLPRASIMLRIEAATLKSER
jgi:hypothetical protein